MNAPAPINKMYETLDARMRADTMAYAEREMAEAQQRSDIEAKYLALLQETCARMRAELDAMPSASAGVAELQTRMSALEAAVAAMSTTPTSVPAHEHPDLAGRITALEMRDVTPKPSEVRVDFHHRGDGRVDGAGITAGGDTYQMEVVRDGANKLLGVRIKT